MTLEIEKYNATSFIATAFGGSNGQTLVNVPKDVVNYLSIDRGDKVEIVIKKTGLRSTRKMKPVEEQPQGDGSI
jgi:hypothetical protein